MQNVLDRHRFAKFYLNTVLWSFWLHRNPTIHFIKILIPVFPTKCSRALVNAEPTARGVLHTIRFRVLSGFVDVGRRPTLPSHCPSLDEICFRILLPFMLSNCPTNLGSNFSRRFCLKPAVITLPHLRM